MMKHLLYLLPCISLFTSCYVDSADFEPELRPVMYLKVNDGEDHKLFGNEASSENRFMAGIKVVEAETRYISECVSYDQDVALKLRITKLSGNTHRPEQVEQPLQNRTYHNSEILKNLQYELFYTDTEGVKWFSGLKDEHSLTNTLTIEQIEPYSSILDGKQLQLITFSFEAEMINGKGQGKLITGQSRTILEEIQL